MKSKLIHNKPNDVWITSSDNNVVADTLIDEIYDYLDGLKDGLPNQETINNILEWLMSLREHFYHLDINEFVRQEATSTKHALLLAQRELQKIKAELDELKKQETKPKFSITKGWTYE